MSACYKIQKRTPLSRLPYNTRVHSAARRPLMHLKYDIICALACLAMERVGMLMLLVSVVQSAVDSLNDKQCSDK